MSEHSSLVATFKEKLRPKYYGKSSSNNCYIKENVYFNGIALKESLLQDNEYPDTQKRILSNRDTKNYANNNRCYEIETGCFIYQNPTSSDDYDIINKFADISMPSEFGVDSNGGREVDTQSSKMKINDREEIRKRLVNGYQVYNTSQTTKKSSLESRLQNGSNLQLCFVNDQSSDSELPSNDSGAGDKEENIKSDLKNGLNQAKIRARAHMMSDHRNCIISTVIKDSLIKVGAKLDNDRRRVSRHFLMRLNLAQLQVIVNDLHSYIEYLNESLVNLLLERDELHMAKDSMLVDIEDLKHTARESY